MLEDFRVSYYVDDMSVPIWTSSTSVDASYGTGPIIVGGNKPNWVDNILISTGAPPPVSAVVDIDPDTLNTKSKGRWVTVYIELPEDYDVADIDVGSLMLEGEICAMSHPTELGDYDADSTPDLMVKFSREELVAYLDFNQLVPGQVELTLTGDVADASLVGSDTIRTK